MVFSHSRSEFHADHLSQQRTGRAFCCELRSDGNYHLIEVRGGDFVDILPEGFSARSRVYEYGGGSYAVLPGARVIFSNFKDNSVYVLDVDEGTVQSLLQSKTLRYGDYDVHRGDEPWVLAVQEDHEIAIPEQVKNYIVAINTKTGEVRRIVEGADFYMFPRFSPDGKKVSWLQWDFPGMPWAGVSLYWADWVEGEIKLDTVEHIAGGESTTVTEPRWGPDGYLYFAEEQTNYYQLFRRKPQDGETIPVTLPGLENVEFGSAKFSCARYAPFIARPP